MNRVYQISRKEISGYKIEYVEMGSIDRPVLIFAHGLGGNLRQWNEQLRFFGEQYHVITFSLQGHGESSIPKSMDECSVERYADVSLTLLEELNISSCTWIGNSMGGVIGYEVLKRRPELIQHLITNGTAPELKYSKRAQKAIQFADRFLIGLLGYERYINIAVHASLKDPGKRQILKELFMASNPLTIRASHQLLGNYSYLDTIAKARTRITFICTPGDKDINKAIKLHEQRLSSMPRVRVIEKEHGGHVWNIERPEEYNRTLEDILRVNFEN